MNKFGVVIVTYNRLELLKESISCVLNQSRKFDLIVVVNNCSNDGTKEFLSTFSLNSTIRVINLKQNIGGAGGFATGLRSIFQEVNYTLLIDDDAILDGNFLAIIEQSISSDIYAYSGSVYSGGRIDTSHRKLVRDNVLMRFINVSCEEYSSLSFDYDLSSFCGLLIGSNLVEKIGLPKEEYFIWYDDTEYSLRIRQYSKIRNVNGAFLNHKTSLKYSDKLSWKSYYGYRNFINVGVNYSNMPYVFFVVRIFFHFIRCIKYLFFSIFVKSERNYYLYASKLNFDVIISALSGRMGKDNRYMPNYYICK